MRGLSQIKGVADVRTAISAHYRNTSRTKGTPYLEILSLGMERLRLESELEWLDKRNARIHRRLDEIKDQLGSRITEVEGHGPPDSGTAGSTRKTLPAGGRWRTMDADY